MRPFPISSLRSRLILLVLFALVPALLLLLYTAVEQQRGAAQQVQQGTLSLVRVVAHDHQAEVDQARLLFGGLGRFPAVRNPAARNCPQFLAGVLESYPRYLNFGVLDASDGRVLCSAREIPPEIRASPVAMAAVQRAVSTGRFSVSEYAVGQVSQRPLLMFVHPIRDADGEIRRVLYGSFGLDRFSQIVAEAKLPPGTTLNVLDPQGVVLARDPGPDAWVGKQMPNSAVLQVLHGAPGERTFTATGLDGQERLYASAPLRADSGAAFAHVIIGVPRSTATAAAAASLRRNLLLLGLLTALALAAAWIGGDLFVLRHVDALLAATRRIKAGDRSARTGLPHGRGELEQLAATFDEMAEALETRHAEAERAAATLRRQALVLDTMLEAVLVTDLERRIVDCNPAAETLFGYSRDELIGRGPAMLVNPADTERVVTESMGALARTGRWSGEIPFVRKDGSEGISDAVVVTQFDESGAPVAHIAVNRDATERLRTERRLRESEASYRSLFDSIEDAVYIQDLDGRLLNVNQVVERLYGYTRDEIAGQTLAMLADPERTDLRAAWAAFRRVVDGQPPQRLEWWARRKDGSTFPKEVILNRATYFGQEVVIAVGRDISERKRAEEELRQREQQLRESQKMEAVGRLAGGVAHDFNNLLTAIRGNVEVALLDLPSASPLRTELEQVQQAAETAASLTRQLLAFSRKQTVEPRLLRLDEVIESTCRLLRRLVGSEVELQTRVDPGLWPVRADSGQLEQVLMNLAINARDAMPNGGCVEVEVTNFVLDAEHPERLSIVAPGEYVLLTVRDSGVGIDPQTQHRIFEPFFTTKEQGTGLGLFTVYGIVRQNGGHVWVESAVGEGSTFRILLPRAREEGAGTGTERPGSDVPAGRETVLLVDDEDSVRMLTRRLLERLGYSVLSASGGEEALRIGSDFAGTIDLLLTDVTMPRMSGRELAERMAAVRPGIPVVYMSGYMEENLPRVRGNGGAPQFIHKPFTLSILASTLRATLDAPA